MASEETCDNDLACVTVLEAVQSLSRGVASVTRREREEERGWDPSEVAKRGGLREVERSWSCGVAVGNGS